MRGIQFVIALLVSLGSTVAMGQVPDTSERRYALPDHGDFVAQVPREWKDQVRQPPNRLPPTIVFRPSAGKPFEILLTTIWPATKGRGPQSREALRAQVERAAKGAKAQAVESQLSVIGFQGRSGTGFYFSATDRAPGPGEYRFMTQGILRVGELSVTFTILTNEGHERVVKRALDLLKSAVQDASTS